MGEQKLSTSCYMANRCLLSTLALLVALVVAADLLLAQGPRGHGRHMGPGPRHGERMGPGMHGQGRMHHRGQGFFRRLRELPPEEQERALANDSRFQRLSPARQQMIRERLRQWNALSPEMKERVCEREEVFMSLSPEQRREARGIFPRWRELAPERRQALMQAFRQLRDAPAGQRKQFLASEEVQKRFSPEEREILAGLGYLLPQGRGEPLVEPPRAQD